MKCKFLFILVLLFIGCSDEHSPAYDFDLYDQFIRQARVYYSEGEYEKALQKFYSAYKVIPNDNENDYLYASAAALYLQREEEARELAIKAIVETNVSQVKLSKFREYTAFAPLNFLMPVLENMATYRNTFYENHPYPEIYKEIDSMIELDLTARTNFGDKELIENLTKSNMERLIGITKAYGWQKNAWMLLWNQRETYDESNMIWDFFIPFINKEIEAHHIRKDFWALFEDEKAIRTKKKQTYGLYTQLYDRYPVEDVTNLDIRRSEAGLPPLWYMSQVYGFIPPKGYPMPSEEEKQAYIFPEQ